MISERELFYKYLAQTSPEPLGLEIVKAEGIYLYDSSGKSYVDLISGISVSNIGHRHPKVIEAIHNQTEKYLHLMVYGEYIQSPQVKLSQKLSSILGDGFDNIYFVNSGSEAVEGAIKLAKKFTKRTQIISFKNAYHGSTHGALSLMGNELLKNPFRPLLPDIHFNTFNNIEELNNITEHTACVIIEPIQGEAGVVAADKVFLQKLRDKCNETATLLIFDEIQTGFGRCGAMFAFQKYGVIPDIITMAKGMAGGMPLGVFASSKHIMMSLSNNPILGHITTFGGHPVSCAASLATIDVLSENNLLNNVSEKENLFHSKLIHKAIKDIRSFGLLIAIELESFEIVKQVISKCLQKGIILDWFLFNNKSIRIAPPLTITNDEICSACDIINESINNCYK